MNKKIEILRCGYCYSDLKKEENHQCPKMLKPISKPVYCFDTDKLFKFFKFKEHKAEQTNKKDDLPPR